MKRIGILILFFFCIKLLSASSLINISGYVKNINGLPIENYSVYLYSDSLIPSIQETTTDMNGYYSFLFYCYKPAIFLVYVYDNVNNHQIIDTLLYYNGLSFEYKVDFVISENNTISDCNVRFEWEIKNNTFSQVAFYQYYQEESPDVSWLWIFGDGTTSNQINPVHQYSSSGEYLVCLHLINQSKNCHVEFCDTVILPTFPCNASFSYVVDSGKAHINAHVSGTEYTFEWITENLSFPSELSFSYFFPQPGDYPVCLIVNDTFSDCYYKFCDTIRVPNFNSCTSDFDYFVSYVKDSLITLSFTSNSVGNINRWFWGLNNDFISDNSSAVISLPTKDSGIVCLTVMNAQFSGYCNNTKCDTIVFPEPPFSCNANFISILDSLENMNVYFSPMFSQSYSNYVVRYYWSFGDGFVSEETNPRHTFRKTGTYKITLIANLFDIIHNNICVCSDSVTKYLTIKDKTCNADFTFEQIENTYEVRFKNLSTGNLRYIHWDFGDSTFSSEENPVHIFNDTLSHNVCLYIEDTAGCTSYICYTVKIHYDLPECNPYFEYNSAGISCSPACIRFRDLSTSNSSIFHRLWNFGDGNSISSLSTNLIHTYENPGNYEVCLDIRAKNFVGLTCEKKFCKNVEIEQFSKYNLGGQVFETIYPVDRAIAQLYRIYDNDEVYFVDEIEFSYLGYYYFYQIPPGDYFVKVMLTETSELYRKGFIPTYTGNAIRWQNAEVIELNKNNYDADIRMVLPLQHNGPCTIKGRIVEENYPEKVIKNKKIEILLLDISDQPYSYTYTDTNGCFSFSNINFGTYKLLAEIPGKHTQYRLVSLTPLNPIDSILLPIPFEQFSPIEIEEESNCNLGFPYKPYPNPFSDFVNITLHLLKNSDVEFFVYNLKGQKEYYLKIHLFAGYQNVKLSLPYLNKGLYVLLIHVNGEIYNKYVIVKKD